ncbi:MAG: SsrA-binding protein [Parcubacteria group bacterium Licking1014_1]|nr:MAG: SsrA-binding protein [Parcubacteria group bacterium Licking1014_1]
MKVFSENKKARYDYDIIDKYEAGLVLIGTEVKSIKSGHIALAGSYVILRNEEAFLIGAKIPAYQPKNAPDDYNPERQRKLLLNKKEINHLLGRSNEKGFSLIPLKIYTKNGRIKIEFGLAKGKKKYNKKEKIKKRDIDREVNRELSSRG